MKKQYFNEINIARGILLLFVLIGHSLPDVQTGFVTPASEWIYKFIYSFHMGGFFILAGFVGAGKLCTDKADTYSEIVRKAKRLMVPYLFYSGVTLILKEIFSAYANRPFDLTNAWKILLLGSNPNGGLWYIWTLFVISVMFLLINRITRKPLVYLCVGFLLYAINLIFPDTPVHYITAFSVYYTIGIFLNRNYEKIKPILYNKMSIIGAVICVTVLCFLVTYVKTIYLVTCLLAIFPVLIISCQIAKNQESKTYRMLDEYGHYSYDIYLISYYVQVSIRVICFRILDMPYWGVVAMMFIFGATIPYFICKYIIRRIPVANKIMLGNWK